MNEFQLKVDSCLDHLAHGDISLAYRKFIDCVLDTENLDFYREAIAIAVWDEENSGNTTEFSEKIKQCLVRMHDLPVVRKEANLLCEISELQKRYRRSNFELKPVSLKLSSGEIWGLVGENGNGKTSLLRMLADDLQKDTGSKTYFGELGKLSGYDLRTKLTYIPQRTPKWQGSLMHNLKFAASHYGISGERNELIVNLYIIRFGLWSFRKHQWKELSSGYKMRFELARTFLRAPKLLLLDEPLANLDVLAQQLILEDLKSLAQSIANPVGIILSSQQLFEVEKVADKLIFLKQGAPVYVNSAENQLSENDTILELDVEATKQQLKDCLEKVGLTELTFNGGVYVATFDKASQMNKALLALIENNIEIRYVRNISESTRRLFMKNQQQ